MYVIGFAFAWWLARRRAAQPESTWSPNDVDDLIFFAAIGTILGGRLGWILFYGTEQVMDDPQIRHNRVESKYTGPRASPVPKGISVTPSTSRSHPRGIGVGASTRPHSKMGSP